MIALYLRTSTDGQAESRTIEQQAEEGIKFALSRGETYLEYRDDGISGGSEDITKRPALIDMLSEITKKSDITAVWVWEISRLARNSQAAALICSELNKKKVKLFVGNTEYDFSNPTEKFTFTILSANSELEKALIFARTQRGKTKLKNSGWKECNFFYGYQKTVKNLSTGRFDWEPVPAEINKLKFLFSHLKTGKSLQAALFLMEPELKLDDNKRWQAISNWSRRIRLYEYTGFTKIPSGEDKPCTNFPLQLISKDEYKMIVDGLDTRSNLIRNHRQAEMSTGLIVCKSCLEKYYHAPLVERRSKSGDKRYEYYKHFIKRHRSAADCKQQPKYLQKDLIDEIFSFVYWFSLSNGPDLQIVKDDLASKKTTEEEAQGFLNLSIDTSMEAEQKKLNRIKRAILEGMEAGDFVAETKKIKDELKRLKRQKENALSGVEIINKNLNLLTEEFVADKLSSWEASEGRDKRAILQKFCVAFIEGEILSIRVIKTNRIHLFSTSTEIERITELREKPVSELERFFAISKPKVFSYVLKNPTLEADEKYYDWIKKDEQR